MKIFDDFVVSPYPPDVCDDGGRAIVGWHYGRRPYIRTVQRARDHHGGEDDHEQCPVTVGFLCLGACSLDASSPSELRHCRYPGGHGHDCVRCAVLGNG